MRVLTALVVTLALAAPLHAQSADEASSFWDRLFGSDDAGTDENQGSFLERLLEDNLSGAGRNVEITGFAGALNGRATMESLTIADDEGVWLTINDAVLDWSRSALLSGRLEISELTAAEILLPRLPSATATEGEAPTPEASGFSLPELPVSVEIGTVAAERVAIGAPVFGSEAEVSLTGGMSLAGGEGDATLDIARRDGRGALQMEGSYSNASRVLGLNLSLNEAADGIFVNLAGLPGRPSVEFTIEGEAPVDDFAANVRLATDGADRLAGQVTARQSETDGEMRFSADIAGDIAPVFSPDYRPFFGDEIALTADVTRHADGRTVLDGLNLTAETVALKGTAALADSGLPTRIALEGTIAAPDGSAVLLPFGEAETRVDRVDLAVSFDAAVSEDWTGRFVIAGLDRQGFSAEALTLNGSGRIVQGEPDLVTARLEFDATRLDFGDPGAAEALGEEVTGTAQIGWIAGQALSFEHLRVEGDTYWATGSAEVKLDADGPVVTGVLDLSTDRLAAFSGLAGRPLGGKATLGTEFLTAPLAGTFQVTAEGTTEDLEIGIVEADRVLAGAGAIRLFAKRDEMGLEVNVSRLETPQARLSGQARLSSGGSTATVTGSLADAGLILSGLEGPVTLSLDGVEDDARDWDVQAEIEGDDLGLTLDGRFSSLYETPRYDGHVEARAPRLAAFSALAGRPLTGALELTADGGATLDLKSFQAVAEARGSGVSVGLREVDRLLDGPVSLRVDATGNNGEILLTSLDLATGILSASASGIVAAEETSVELQSRLADVAPFVQDLSGPLTVEGTVARAGETGDFAVDLSGVGPGGATARASGTVAPDFATANLDLNGTVPLGLTASLTSPNVLAGTAGFALKLEGPIGLSSLSGQVSATQARIVLPEAGIALNGVAMNAGLGGGRAEVTMAGSVDGGGTVGVEGPIALTAPFPARLEIRLNDVVMTDPRLYETSVSGTASVEGPLAGGASIFGRLVLGETNIRIPNSSIGGAGAIPEVVHLREPPPVRSTRIKAGLLGDTSDAKRSGPVYGLDVRVEAPNRLFIRGRGLESEFGGQLRLTGTTADVIPRGALTLVRGRLDILGRRLQLDEAQVTIQGSFEPYLNLRATTQAEDYLVGVTVIGPASNPEFIFSSVPELPEEEVLARLIFGRGIEDMSAFQAAQLALAVRTLSGQGGESVVSKIRSRTGLDDLEVVTGADGETAVRAGAYLSDKLYTDVTVDSEGETQLNLNLDLSRSITLKGGVTNEGETSLGVFFERDY